MSRAARAAAPGPRARPILSTCSKALEGLPRGGGDSRLEKLTGFSEAMAMYDADQSGSASAWTGENGLDRAASKGLATSAAATMARLQLYKNHGADGSKSDKSASTSARAGENGLDRAASKVFAPSTRRDDGAAPRARGGRQQVRRKRARPPAGRERPRPRCLQGSSRRAAQARRCRSRPATLQKLRTFVAPNATKAGIDVLDVASAEVPLQGTIKQEAATMRPNSCPGKPTRDSVRAPERNARPASTSWTSRPPSRRLCRHHIDVGGPERDQVGLRRRRVGPEQPRLGPLQVSCDFGQNFLCEVGSRCRCRFGLGVPRRSSLAKGAAWSSSVVGYLLFWPEIALVAAARLRSAAQRLPITKSSKIKTNESPSSSVKALSSGACSRAAATTANYEEFEDQDQ